MIIGFDGTILREPRTGIGYYTYFLIRHLLLLEAGLEPRLYNGIRMRPAAFPDEADGEAQQSAQTASTSLANALRKSTLIRAVWRQFKAAGFRRAVRHVDLFHATNYLTPDRTDACVLPLIHDISHIRHPEWHPIERVKWLEARAQEWQQVPLINTVSEFSAREIAATFGIPRERIHVTYPGINPIYRRADASDPAVLARFGIRPGRYFLCVGTLEPRKNLATVIQAFSQLPRNSQACYPLIVVGPTGWGNLELPAATEMLVARGVLRFTGYLDEWSMRALYRDCTALLFPSRYEGFGMPVSEAMALGARPVIATGGAPEEVAGSCGVAVPARDADAWSRALFQAIDEGWHADTALRNRLTDASLRFDWLKNAQETKLAYDRLIQTK